MAPPKSHFFAIDIVVVLCKRDRNKVATVPVSDICDVIASMVCLQRRDSSESLDGVSSASKRLNNSMKSYDAVVFDVLKVSPDDFAVSTCALLGNLQGRSWSSFRRFQAIVIHSSMSKFVCLIKMINVVCNFSASTCHLSGNY